MGDHVELAHLGLLLLLSLDGGHTGGLGKLLTQEDIDFLPSVIRKLLPASAEAAPVGWGTAGLRGHACQQKWLLQWVMASVSFPPSRP